MTRPRLALTSTPERSAALESIAVGAGLEPVSLPCIECVPADATTIDMARDRAARCDWLVLSSSRTVTTLWPDGGMPDVPVVAVGPATAGAVRSAGGNPSLVGDAGSEELFGRMSGVIAGRSVFFPHAATADLSRLDTLETAGATIDTLAVYDVEPLAPGDDAVDAVAFGSPSAVAGWLLSRTLDRLVIGAIGETTAHSLEARGRVPDVIPDHPSFEELIGLIGAGLRDRSTV